MPEAAAGNRTGPARPRPDQEVEPGVDDGELRLTVHALRALLIAWKGRGTVCGRRELSHEIAGRRLPGDIGFYIGR